MLEQNYEYDLLEPDKLLRKYVGRDVTSSGGDRTDGATREEEVKARLLSYNNAPVWQIGGEIVTGMRADHIRFPELPGNLYSRPTLIWTLDNSGGARHRVEASYLAGKLSWNADYVLTVARDDKAGRSRRLGDADERQRHVVPKREAAARRRRSQPRPAGLSESADGHGCARRRRRRRRADGAGVVLRLPPLHARPKDDDQQQRDQAGEHAERAPAFPVQQALRRRRPGVLLPQRPASRVRRSRTSCRSTTSSRTRRRPGLGMPMPAGIVRVYQADSKGGMQFVGEDRIDHTPKDEDAQPQDRQRLRRRLRAQADRLPEDRDATSTRSSTRSRCATTRRSPVTVEVNEPIGGTWRMLRSSHEWTKTAAWAAQFAVPVAVDGTAVLTYRQGCV